MLGRGIYLKLLYAYRYGIVGGVSTQLLLRQQALEAEGIGCELFFSQDNGLRQVIEGGRKVHFDSECSFKSLVNRGRFDAVVVIDSPELLAAAGGPLWCRNKVYLDVHTTTHNGLSYLADVKASRLSGVMVPTHYSAGLVEKRLSYVTAKVVPNILDARIFSPASGEAHVSVDPVRQYVWVGKLDHHKNWRLALVYARLLKDMLGPIHLTMVGGYTAPPDTAEAFFALAYRLGVPDAVTWLDRVENHQLASLYRRCAASGGAMLVTSRDESFGMAAAEALMCGCPLITNDLPVFREVFPESPMVKRVDIWQPEQVADAAQQLTDGVPDGEVSRMYEQLCRRYGAESFVDTFKTLLTGS